MIYHSELGKYTILTTTKLLTLAPEDDIADYVANKVGACLGEFLISDSIRQLLNKRNMKLFQLLNKLERIHQCSNHHVTPIHFPQCLEKSGKSCQITKLETEFFPTNQEMY